MNHLLITLFAAFAAFYLLWIFYLAVMNLKRAKDGGLLTATARFFGTPVLIVGWLLDAAVNILLMSIILLELPREMTVTARLKRHNRTSTGWRKAIVLWFEPLLDPYDPSGDHI